MDRTAVRKVIYSKIEELPTLPAVLPKVLSLVESDKSSAADIAAVITNDPALAAKILKVANSAYYGFSREVTAIQMAVGLLGLNMVRSLALSIGVLQSLPQGKARTNFSQEGLWKHSLAAATIMQELRTLVGAGESGDHHFIVGLLHDVGKVVLDQFFGDIFQAALEEAAASGCACLHEMEKKQLGLDHAEIGAMLLSRWQFPEIIIRTILGHHQPGALSGEAARDRAMLRLADTLAYRAGLGGAGNPAPPVFARPEGRLIGLDKEKMEKLKGRLENVEDAVDAFYSAIF